MQRDTAQQQQVVNTQTMKKNKLDAKKFHKTVLVRLLYFESRIVDANFQRVSHYVIPEEPKIRLLKMMPLSVVIVREE